MPPTFICICFAVPTVGKGPSVCFGEENDMLRFPQMPGEKTYKCARTHETPNLAEAVKEKGEWGA